MIWRRPLSFIVTRPRRILDNFSSKVLEIARAPVAQLDRASGFEPAGRRFNSCRAHQTKTSAYLILLLLRTRQKRYNVRVSIRVSEDTLQPSRVLNAAPAGRRSKVR